MGPVAIEPSVVSAMVGPIETGELTPTLKLERNVLHETFGTAIEAICS